MFHLEAFFFSPQVQKILQSSQQKEGAELRTLLTNPHLQVSCQLAPRVRLVISPPDLRSVQTNLSSQHFLRSYTDNWTHTGIFQYIFRQVNCASHVFLFYVKSSGISTY